MNPFKIVLILPLLWTCTILTFAQTVSSEQVSLTVDLVELPGSKVKESRVQFAFELRVMTQQEEIEATRAGKTRRLDEGEKLGRLVGRGSIDRSALAEIVNRSFFFNIDLDEPLREALKQAPRIRRQFSAQNLDEETVRLLKEDQKKALVFVLYGNAIIDDGVLKQRFYIPVNRVLPLYDYPSAAFRIAIALKADRTFVVKTESGVAAPQQQKVVIKQSGSQ